MTSPTPTKRSAWRSMRTVWMVLAVIAGVAIMSRVVYKPQHKPDAADTRATERKPPVDVVQLVGPRQIRVEPGCLLDKKLEVSDVHTEKVTYPVLTVTGFVIARLVSGTSNPEDRWNFSSTELLQTYVEYLKSGNEVAFAEKQVNKITELSQASVAGHEKVVARLRKLVESGTDAPKDLAAAETELLQAQLQGQKEIYGAESTLKTAQTSRASLERQLFQAGVDPEFLTTATEGEVVVVADVPEARISSVQEGQSCEARFYGLPNQAFPGTVGRLSPTLSGERRTLRVPFELVDTKEELKPGMFAEIGLGTNARDSLIVPTVAVLHVARTDYVLVAGKPDGVWTVTEVTVGEPHGGKSEIFAGLDPSDRVIGSGAILLKPFVVDALRAETPPDRTGRGRGPRRRLGSF